MNTDKTVNHVVTAVCAACSQEFQVEQAVKERAVTVPDESNVKEVGLKCPHCGGWTHAYFTTSKTRRFMASLKRGIALFRHMRTEARLKALRRAETRYKKVFDEEQKRLRALFGVQSPTADVLGQQIIDIPKDGEE